MDHASLDIYQSPFSWRYGSEAMRAVWSEGHKRRLWRRIWVALAEAQSQLGLVKPQQVEDLRAHAGQVDLDRALQIEAEIKHDLMAEVKTFAEQCRVGGGIIHLGATSADVEDNADALRLRESLDLILDGLASSLRSLGTQIEKWADTPAMAFTHIQPAEPTTIGYRLAQYAQDLTMDYAELARVRAGIRGKGFKGAVGTSAAYIELTLVKAAEPSQALESLAMRALDLEPFDATTQTYPRKQDWLVLNALAGLAMSLYKFALDWRILQSPPIGEWSEPFGSKQVGSSAMPFKRNPVNAEKIDSLARYLAQLPRIAWDNAANSVLERGQRLLDEREGGQRLLGVVAAVGGVDQLAGPVEHRELHRRRADVQAGGERALLRFGGWVITRHGRRSPKEGPTYRECRPAGLDLVGMETARSQQAACSPRPEIPLPATAGRGRPQAG